MKAQPRFVGIDLFCGCGGVTRGFLDSGINVALGVDWEPAFKRTYEQNNRVDYLSCDIRALSASEVLSRIGRDRPLGRAALMLRLGCAK